MVLCSEDREPLDPRLFFNTDKSSSLFNEEVKMVVLSSFGIKKELGDHNRNVTATSTGKEEKKRGVAYSVMTSCAGKLISVCTHIKDHAFNIDGCVKTYKLGDTDYLQTIPTSLSNRPAVNDETDDNEEDIADNFTIAEQEAGYIINNK